MSVRLASILGCKKRELNETELLDFLYADFRMH